MASPETLIPAFPQPRPDKLDGNDVNQLRTVLHVLKSGEHCEAVDVLDAWIDKIIRMIEINRRQLKQLFNTRFGDTDAHSVVFSILVSKAWPGTESVRGGLPSKPDMRALNAALWLDDAAQSLPDSAELKAAQRDLADLMEQLPERLNVRGNGDWCENFSAAPTFERPGITEAIHPDRASVVVLSPNFRSRNTIATLHQLAKNGITVSNIFVRRLGSFSRLMEELRFSPMFLLKRVMTELVFPKLRRSGSDSANLANYMREIECTDGTVEGIARRLGDAQIGYFSSFNDPACIEVLKEIRPDYGVFTGGGILNEAVLASFRYGIVHAHPGILPQYKGMDVVQWAILEGQYGCVGSTCQIMSPTLDAGPLVANQIVDIAKYDNLSEIRTAVVEGKIDLVCESLRALISGARKPVSHPPGGKLYLLMHSRLVKLVRYIVDNNLHKPG